MTRSHRPYLIGFFLAVIYAAPLGQTAIELLHGRRPGFLEVFGQPPSGANLRAFERELERSCAAAETVRPWLQYAWFTVLGEAGEKTVLGRDGWMFYRPDVRYLVESRSPDGPLGAIADFRNQLARRGIRLLVAPVPGKPSVYPGRLSRRAGPRQAVGPTGELIARLRRSGIETVDLLDEASRWCGEAEPCYLRRDTHWTGPTARRAAEMVAARIRALGWLDAGSIEYAVRPVRLRRQGDLVRMMNTPALERLLPPEEVRCEQVVRRDTGELYRDDESSPVLVLGDSFLRIYQGDEPHAAGFIAHLARALGTPVASVVNDGGASTLVRQQLARRPKLLAGKKVVVWEFVERDILFGTDGWQPVALPGD